MGSKKNRMKDPLDIVGWKIDEITREARRQCAVLRKVRDIGFMVGEMAQEDVVEHMFIDTPSHHIAKLVAVTTTSYSNQVTFAITIANVVQLPDALEYLDALECAFGHDFTGTTDIESDGHRAVVMQISSAPYADKDKVACVLIVRLYPIADDFEGELPEGIERCRKVLVGMDSHTYTSQTPKYKIICG